MAVRIFKNIQDVLFIDNILSWCVRKLLRVDIYTPTTISQQIYTFQESTEVANFNFSVYSNYVYL